MKRWVAGFLLGLSGCGAGGEAVVVTESADAGGVVIRATSEVEDDSVRVRVRLVNELDTSADITLNGGCPITLIAYAGDELVWDERDQLACEQPDIPIPLAPGEVKDLFRSVAEDADPSLGTAEAGEVGVRVLVATDEEYLLEAGPR